MSSTIAHKRTHIHIPWTTIVIVLVSALAAAAVLVLINQPADVSVQTQPGVLTAPGAVAMPQLETHAEILALTGRGPGVAEPTRTVPDTLHNFPTGALEADGSAVPVLTPAMRIHLPAKALD